MVQAISATDAIKKRRRLIAEGIEYHRTEYFLPSSPIGATLDEVPLNQRGAQAFIVEQSPNSVVPSHFHISNQFQVVVGGSGTLGRHEVRPFAVHYAGSYTGYGPITAGDDGLAYFTLRAQFDSGPHVLPKCRSELKNVVRQLLLKDGIRTSNADELSARDGAVLETIIAPQETGLAGYLARLGPKASLDLPPPQSGGGQYWVVVAGGIFYNGEDLPQSSCLFIAPTDPKIDLEAGSSGAEVLILQYPKNPEPVPKLA